jgi:hypothetical protein
MAPALLAFAVAELSVTARGSLHRLQACTMDRSDE